MAIAVLMGTKMNLIGPKFLTVCSLTPMADGRNWRLDQPLVYAPAAGGHITVPTGFVTDLASIPRIFWNIMPPFGKYTEAAIVHDYIYRLHSFSRSRCDALFREMMTVLKVKSLAKWTIYIAVRAFGWIAWRNEKRWLKPKSQILK